MKLLSPSALSISQIRDIYARADEIAAGAKPNLSESIVAAALFDTAFPLPLDATSVLREFGVRVELLDSPEQIKTTDANAILFSHPKSESAAEYSRSTTASFFNAGDGTSENPVRALMDAHAIRALRGDLSELRVAILGNLKFSAEAHSLARLLGIFGARLSFVTPAALSMPYDLTDEVRLNAYEVEETNDLATTLRKTDALYLAKIDSVRVEKKIYDKLKSFYVLSPDTLAKAKEGLVILGEWDDAASLLAASRQQVETSARAVLLALVELA